MQYIHQHHNKPPGSQSKTYAFKLPAYGDVELETLDVLLKRSYVGRVSMMVGVATLHKDDKYVKAVGRQVAEKNMETVDFAIRKVLVYPEDSEVILTLYSFDLDLHIRMVLRKTYRNIRILAVY